MYQIALLLLMHLIDGDDGQCLADAAAQRHVDLVLPRGEGVGAAGEG